MHRAFALLDELSTPPSSALLDEPAAAEDGVERGAARGVEAQAAVEQRDGGGREPRRRGRARSSLVRGSGLGVRQGVRLGLGLGSGLAG